MLFFVSFVVVGLDILFHPVLVITILKFLILFRIQEEIVVALGGGVIEMQIWIPMVELSRTDPAKVRIALETCHFVATFKLFDWYRTVRAWLGTAVDPFLGEDSLDKEIQLLLPKCFLKALLLILIPLRILLVNQLTVVYKRNINFKKNRTSFQLKLTREQKVILKQSQTDLI